MKIAKTLQDEENFKSVISFRKGFKKESSEGEKNKSTVTFIQGNNEFCFELINDHDFFHPIKLTDNINLIKSSMGSEELKNQKSYEDCKRFCKLNQEFLPDITKRSKTTRLSGRRWSRREITPSFFRKSEQNNNSKLSESEKKKLFVEEDMLNENMKEKIRIKFNSVTSNIQNFDMDSTNNQIMSFNKTKESRKANILSSKMILSDLIKLRTPTFNNLRGINNSSCFICNIIKPNQDLFLMELNIHFVITVYIFIMKIELSSENLI